MCVVEAEFIPQSHTFFLTYTPVVRWQAPSLLDATRREGLKRGKRARALVCGEAILEENRKSSPSDTAPTPR